MREKEGDGRKEGERGGESRRKLWEEEGRGTVRRRSERKGGEQQ